MHFEKWTYGLVIFLCCSFSLMAQQEEAFIEEQIIEQLIEDLDADVDVSEFTEQLRYYMRNPIDLNKAKEEDLASLIFLTPQQISNLIHHRETTGYFISFLELQGIDGFDLHTITLLEPFVQVSEVFDWKGFTIKDFVKNSGYEIMTRYGRIIEKQRGYDIEDESRSRYLGSPDRIATRIRVDYENRIKLAINMDKDAGEPFFRERQRYGFDFYSGSLLVRDVGKARRIVLGDYALQFGQGLVIWNGLSFGKGAWIGSVTRQGAGLNPYTSLNENNFLRGGATALEFGRWTITPFVSWNKLSGNVIEHEGRREIRSINYSGYHRTPTEQAYRHAINQYVYGFNASYQHRRLKIGVTTMTTYLDGYYKPAEELRNLFAFEGNQVTNLGIHYQYTYRNMYLYGETAHSLGSGFASTNGIIASLNPKLTAIVNYRNYQRNYHHFFAQSIGELSTLGNEKGFYGGLIYHPSRKIEWVNYLDVFRFPWLRFRADAPTSGMDFLSQLSYIWYKRGRLTFRYRQRMRQENENLPDRNEHVLADVWRNQGRLDFQYKLNDQWGIRSRLEMSYYYKEFNPYEYGYLGFQDVLWKSRDNRYTGNLRVAYFNTASYDSRIYAYEQDVLYGAGFPTYYGQGIRAYVNTRIRVGRRIDLWGRYATTIYRGVETIGSQLDVIEGNRRSDFRIQIRYRMP